jgi:hypothetical protein
MANEAGAPRVAPVYVNGPPPGTPYRKFSHPGDSNTDTDVESLPPPRRAPSATRSTRLSSPFSEPLSPWGALGERLNINHKKMGWAADDDSDVEMGTRVMFSQMPFAAQPGTRMLAEGEEVHHVPRQVSWVGALQGSNADLS